MQRLSRKANKWFLLVFIGYIGFIALTVHVYSSGTAAYAYEASFYDDACGSYECDPQYAAERHFYQAPAPVQTQEPELTSQPIVYQVNSGDTLYRIARTFGVTVNDLTAVNGIQDANSLKIGQELVIPKMIDMSMPTGSAPVVSKVLMSTLTAYTAGVESTGKRPSDPGYGTTYSGSSATEGRTIAVDPRVIPIGATVFIDGIGVRKAEDIGSAIRGARIDVFMNDLGEAREFGIKQNVLVYVLA
ncbi:3D domain-containing protein [Paenibacillus koleovorans]|uniref:3D domain-containing protein n=1 Tax=Paenibacillus koleovorans TaxID=121608 RepID=UPI000FDB3183|nr:3D domain-containing protein [Paenibacillus koleovorans]